jgi:hypothetical protein
MIELAGYAPYFTLMGVPSRLLETGLFGYLRIRLELDLTWFKVRIILPPNSVGFSPECNDDIELFCPWLSRL